MKLKHQHFGGAFRFDRLQECAQRQGQKNKMINGCTFADSTPPTRCAIESLNLMLAGGGSKSKFRGVFKPLQIVGLLQIPGKPSSASIHSMTTCFSKHGEFGSQPTSQTNHGSSTFLMAGPSGGLGPTLCSKEPHH